MKLPFVSRTKYETARNNLRVESEARQKIRKAYIELQETYIELQEKSATRDLAYQQMEDNCKQICDRLDYMAEKEKDYKREIKNLKTLCTKNGIEYKKEEK